MKNIFKISFVLILGFLLYSCEDDDKTVIGEGTPPSLKSDVTSVVLESDNNDDKAITFEWVNSNYGINLEISNSLEFALKGSDFASPKLTVIEGGLTKRSLTVEELNTIILSMGVGTAAPTQIEVRLKSEIPNYRTYYSNVIALTVTPYITELPSFYLVGDASSVGWSEVNAKLLYKKDNFSTIYTYLENGKSFRFLGQQAWSPLNYSLDATGMNNDYKYFKTWSPNLVAAPSENIQFTGTTGMYKIAINADPAQKSIVVSPSSVNVWNPANLYIVGTVNGWDVANAIAMTNLGDGKFEYTTTLAAASEFKFLGQQSWGSLDWGNIESAGNTGYLGPKDSNGNIKFDGTGGNYKISVDLKLGVYKIQPL
ncbi:hypothetical protein IQ37_12810 [Chryseobacterium piperi]|uniref:SusE outer membrane protein domain-containing protein n=1 Tax=Chryseobacterium piperi TaxID=558152 RepID=A0A086B7S6_9FLAO|nr:SusE domain-containing protein [Chryseobacterium piperi]ASW74080.1 DUF5116 domain-containing protein [Chryseobacterium piperi]KFF24990.1 hypothetical protein IQ37_12810 [Chryseobacterium piperi]